ncbi:MAG TPA: hypothetical protein VLM89_03485 [Phycisphaerae bacterium]|nr:hypothetical protein [Phycisphaerae bacterium]
MRKNRLRIAACSAALLLGTWAAVAAEPATPGFLGGTCRLDKDFPKFMPMWREGWKLTDEKGDRLRHAYPGMPLGSYLHVFIQNTTSAEIDIDDVLLNGVSLKQGIAPDSPPKDSEGKFASHILFSKLPTDQIETLTDLGEPVWWRADPFTIAPNGFAELIIRLRRAPKVQQADVRITGKGFEIQGAVSLNRVQPRVVGIGYSPAMDRVYLYVRHPKGALKPARILMDGNNASDDLAMLADPAVDTALAAVRTPKPLQEGDFHLFHVHYEDESVAVTGVRVQKPDFLYGMWGYPRKAATAAESVAPYIDGLALHNLNIIMFHYGSQVREYVRSEAGQAHCARLGIQIMDKAPGGYPNQRYTFLRDEPDASDSALNNINPPGKRIGSLAQWLIGMGRGYRQREPRALQVVNIDNTFKPEQWYTYGAMTDVASADPYYQAQLQSVYKTDPGALGAYTKPTYVYAAGTVFQSACAPRPMHLILHTCRFDFEDSPFRAPTPEEKRIEVFYSIASGAKGISYWWYTPGGRFNGAGGDAPELKRLYNEIGLVGAEVRTAEALIGRGCPVQLDIDKPRTLWVRSLMGGEDTLVIFAVNDDIICDRLGTVVQPINKAALRFKAPNWLKTSDVFEITREGTRDIEWKSTEADLSLDLGTVNVTRLLVVTADSQLRQELQGRYDRLFASNVRRLLSEREQLDKEGEK